MNEEEFDQAFEDISLQDEGEDSESQIEEVMNDFSFSLSSSSSINIKSFSEFSNKSFLKRIKLDVSKYIQEKEFIIKLIKLTETIIIKMSFPNAINTSIQI